MGGENWPRNLISVNQGVPVAHAREKGVAKGQLNDGAGFALAEESGIFNSGLVSQDRDTEGQTKQPFCALGLPREDKESLVKRISGSRNDHGKSGLLTCSAVLKDNCVSGHVQSALCSLLGSYNQLACLQLRVRHVV